MLLPPPRSSQTRGRVEPNPPSRPILSARRSLDSAPCAACSSPTVGRSRCASSAPAAPRASRRSPSRRRTTAASLHAASADALVEIASYLDPAEHVRAARESGADAVHPGYGFLSESAELAEAVLEAGLTWVGPPPAALRAGGDKLAAKETARAAGVPVLPSGDARGDRLPAARQGGRRRRRARHARRAGAGGARRRRSAAARREAAAAFGDDTVFCERYLERPRHVEIQLLADKHGNVASLGERDCSIQRRHQKVLEESPSPALDPELRARMSDAAVAFARAIGYESAGTAEFVLDGRDFCFLELNARIQVEHPGDGARDRRRHRARAAADRVRRGPVQPSNSVSLARARGRGAAVRGGPALVPPAGRAGSSGCGCRRGSASTRACARATRSAPRTTR